MRTSTMVIGLAIWNASSGSVKFNLIGALILFLYALILDLREVWR